MIADNDTRDRLLRGAREVFAERGLQNATVRDICMRARVNIAAVSYHFGGKEKLYAAVLQDYIERQNRSHPSDEGVTPASPPEERLRAFVRSILLGILGDGLAEGERLGKLLAQEFVAPSQHFGMIFDQMYRPALNLLLDIVRQLLPGADEARVAQCASSISGQCALYRFAKASIARVTPDLALTAGNVERITDFILHFSLGGVERVAAAG